MKALRLAASDGSVVSTPARRTPTDRDPGTPTPVEPLVPGSHPPKAKRTDAEGMARVSLYVSADAAADLTAAVTEIQAALEGHHVPKHVVLSALIRRGTDARDQVIADLKAEIAAELRRQIEQLQGEPE